MATSKVPKYAITDYLPTNVSVEVSGERVLAFDYAEKNQGVVHVMTAWKPPDVSRTPDENDSANKALRLEIEALGHVVVKARGSDPRSTYFEDSWAVLGLDEEEAVLLARKFEQAAIFRITRNRQTVLGCGEKRWSVWRGNRRTLGIRGAIDFINDSQNTQYLQGHLNRYFGINGSKEIFQGRNFEWFVKSTAKAATAKSAFHPTDFLAIAALSVNVPAETQRHLLEDSKKYTPLLEGSTKQETEHQQSGDMGWMWVEKTPLMQLYDAVNTLPGIGRVVCSKLLATKFPNLIPIRDSRVEKLLEIKATGLWWKPLHEIHDAVKPTLMKLSGVDSAASTLRALDVLLWMESSERGF